MKESEKGKTMGLFPSLLRKKDEMSLEEVGELNLRCHGNIFGGGISGLQRAKVDIYDALKTRLHLCFSSSYWFKPDL